MTRKKVLVKRWRAGRGAVTFIALLLLGSAGLRLSTSGALAQATEGMVRTAQGDSVPSGLQNADQGVERIADRENIGRMLSELRAREARIRDQEAQIALRRKALEVADAEITKRLETLEEAESDLRQTLALADGAAENDLARLTAVYENMKAKDAAALFETMEPAFAAGFLGRMRPDVAAAVLAGLTPEAAYTISVILAGRNAKVPKT